MMGRSSPGPRTRAERTGYRETSRYADVIAFIDSLRGRPELAFGSIGRTAEGREIPYVIASRPRVTSPAEARQSGRPIVYVQGNIHAGEIEGKEALLALLRDLTASRRANVLDSVVLIAVPIYNADGNERFASQRVNRGSQNGPEMVGQRPNAQGLDLNRDYVKAEAPETRAALAMFNLWDPHLFVDLHTTNGSYHGYALTYAPALNPASPLGAFTRDSLMPVLRQRMRDRHRLATFDYGDFVSDDTLSKGWATFDPRPRFGTNYYGVRGRIGILSEAYSHDPLERRVASTYAFVREILSLSAERGSRIRFLSQPAESFALMRIVSPPPAIAPRDPSRARSRRAVPLRSRSAAAPESAGVVAEIIERTGDSTITEVGVPSGRRRSGRFVTVRMPVFDRFIPTLWQAEPDSYILSAADTQAVQLLRTHGVIVQTLEREWRGAADVFAIDSVIISLRAFQGHRETRVEGRWHAGNHAVPAGSFIVRTDQPLGVLAIYLIEPQSDDGLATWNFFDHSLKAGATFPALRVMSSPR